jgi:hypothetical protein
VKRLPPLVLSLIAVCAAAQQRPVPDPRLEVALSTSVIKEAQRSVELRKAVPRAAARMAPAVDEPHMARVGEAVYVDRRWLPARAPSEDAGAVRVRPSDR